jgi:hypothetical protein
MGTKLHELLAVESEAQAQFNVILAETRKVFAQRGLFTGSATTFTPFSEELTHLASTEFEEIATTVIERLNYTGDKSAQYFDIVLQKEATNQQATADLVVDGKVIGKDLPATFLLGLETKLKKVREAILSMPTLDNKVEWAEAKQMGPNVYKTAHDEKRFRTRKETKAVVLYEATEHHPAQVKEVTNDVPWGEVVKVSFSGAVTSAYKAEVLDRIARLLAATKQARQRANCAEVVKKNIGADLFKYILG